MYLLFSCVKLFVKKKIKKGAIFYAEKETLPLGRQVTKNLQNKNETPVSKAHERKLNLKKKEVDTMSNYEFEQMEKELQEILQESMEMNLTQEQEEEQNKTI